MKCLVTGAAGFIGSHLCERLVKLGYDVVGVDDLSAGKLENLEGIDVKFYMSSVLNIKMMDDIFSIEKPDIVFNQMASKKTVCLDDPKKDCDVNAKGTLYMLQLSKKYGVKKFVHASTGSVFGEHKLTLRESTYRNPCSYYGISKLAGENYVQLFSKEMNCTILRYFHVYGERQDSSNVGGVIAIFIDKLRRSQDVVIFGDGKQKRLFTYVGDVVDANIASIDYDGGVFNCASDEPIILNDVVYKIQDLINNDLSKPYITYKDWQIGDIKDFSIDNSLIKKELGVSFTKFNEGIKRLI